MKTTRIILAAGLALAAQAAIAGDIADTAPVTDCHGFPAKIRIDEITSDKANAVCAELLRILEGVTAGDLRFFQKASVLFVVRSYKTDEAEVAHELVDIIRLRGLYNKRARWQPTLILFGRPSKDSTGS